MNNSEQPKKAMIEALRKSLGNVSTASQMAGVGRTTHYDWMKTDEEYKKAVEGIGEEAIDFVESKLFELINGVTLGKDVDGEVKVYDAPPCKTSIIFYLKTKAKSRGYIERSEVSINKEPNLPGWMD